MLIGFTGLAHSGKDKAGSVLFMNHGFIRVAIADPVKTAAAVLFGLDAAEFHDDALKNQIVPQWGISRRTMMQRVGDMVKKDMGNEFWILNWFNRYVRVGDANHVVVTDVRFDYEAERIIQLGGIIVKIERYDAGLSGDAAAHNSEQGISTHLISHTIDNNGLVCDLKHSLEALLKRVRAAA